MFNTSDLKSSVADTTKDFKVGSSINEQAGVAGLLSALHSEVKNHMRETEHEGNGGNQNNGGVGNQSFMNKLNSSAAPLLKPAVSLVSFGQQSSCGVVSGMPSAVSVTNGAKVPPQSKQDNNVFRETSQSQLAFQTLIGRSVTPRAPIAVTSAVTVGANKTINTPKYAPPMGLGTNFQELPNDSSRNDARSQKSKGSAFKLV